MSAGSMALTIIFVTIVIATLVGVWAGRHRSMDLEQWSVGGRSFGTLLIWLLMAGEIYTTFTYLGASGWAYSQGAPVFYIPVYGTLAYIFSYFLLPAVWRVGKRLRLVTQPDFFVARYEKRWVGALFAIIGVIFMIPYLELQLSGLGEIVQIASYGAIAPQWAMVIAFLLTAIFVYVSGLRGSAWVSVIKDSFMLILVIALGLLIPAHYFGSPLGMLHRMSEVQPQHLVLPGATQNHGISWFISTVLLTGIGFFMWPQSFGAVYSSKDEQTIRKNAILLPFYQIMFFFIIFVGLTAFLVLPKLENGDFALMSVVKQTYPAWVVGLAGAGGTLAAMVPASVLLMGSGTLIARNIWQGLFRPHASVTSVATMARWAVFPLAAIALYFAIAAPSALVNLLLIGYDGVTQFIVAVVLGLLWRRTSIAGVVSGLVVGEIVVGSLLIRHHDPLWGINAGVWALAANLVVTVVVSLFTPPARAGFERIRQALQD
ncbi:MAG: sodium:solute symporter family protein [Firmicutes bacterium]|nr:sodium:solute symporter family protein [Bacillota bacterium]